MTQQIINNGIVLYRLGINRDEVENISKILDLTPELKAVLTNPVIPIERRINIIEKVFSKADASDKMISFLKKMCRLGYSDSLKDIFEAFWKSYHHFPPSHRRFVPCVWFTAKCLEPPKFLRNLV
mgnify:CR=1 FL=1